jgi:aryl-alcohol dehydrogenase-like predicted oxidoreductase/NAD-dependent dihydropyrimidine dehydrogenase PreA subunit
MEYRLLGNTGLRVSRLCFGTLAIGPLQGRLSLAEGEALLEAAFVRGINFFDSAESYGTYPYLGRLTRMVSGPLVLAAKSYAYNRQDMRRSLERALDELCVDRVDLFLLHEQESAATLAGHRDALELLAAERERGRVGAIGMSSHHVPAVEAAVDHPLVEVVHPLINREGRGIRNGDLAAMLRAVRRAHDAGKGVYAMKALAGGLLRQEAEQALAFVRDLPGVDAVAVGMKDLSELEANCAVMQGDPVSSEVAGRLSRVARRIQVEEDCTRCGSCQEACPQEALTMAEHGPVVDPTRCILCGYCGAACPGFCLRVV